MRTKRIQQVKAYIYKNKTVTLDQICQYFNISKSTIRRDLGEILEDKSIKKIYGGVTVRSQNKLTPFEERNICNRTMKEKIARTAASLIDDDDIVFIDSGTTTPWIIDGLIDKKNITILTNNIEIILKALPYNNLNIICLSGALNRSTLSFTGPSAVQVLQNFNISKAFMAATGFAINSGATNSSPEESDIKKTAVMRSQKVYLLADSGKCGAVALITYCNLKEINCLVTDAYPPDETCGYLEANNVQIIIAK